jgi:uncharacterized protein YukE
LHVFAFMMYRSPVVVTLLRGVIAVALVEVLPGELERAAGRLAASAEQVRSVVGSLVPAAGGVAGGLGDPALAERFQALWVRWARELGVIADDLSGAAGRLQAAAAEYRTTDRNVIPPAPRRAM